MVFGVIEGDATRERAGDEFRGVFFAVTIDVDVEPFLGDIVAELAVAGAVVIVPDDRRPLALEAVLQLHDEPSQLTAVCIEADPFSETARQRPLILSLVVARRVRHHEWQRTEGL
uniref:hypothetical protein n=1 Tax=Halorientalis regularis TaxID=660518 RepID=UPI001587E670|nr:hypothetical protein [Halorientalis regularis]